MRRHSSKDKVRYAVVGLGHIAQVAVLPAFNTASNSELFALVSGDQKKLSTLGKKYSLEHLYSYKDYSRALANVDAAYIALPNHLHREYAVRAAAAGVHVLCEKPMAATEEECTAMIKAAQQNHAKLMVAYRLHFEAGNLHAIDLAQKGKIGEPRIFTSEFSQQIANGNVRVSEPTARGGGPIYDMGVYCINAARYLFRAEPIEVYATAGTKPDPRFARTEEMVSVVMRFPHDRLATFICSFGVTSVSRYSLLGTKGTITADPAYGYAKSIELEVAIGDKTQRHKFPKRDQFAAEIEYFSNCILKDKQPEPSGFEGLADVRIVEAIYESIRMRRSVSMAAPVLKKRPAVDQEVRRPAHDEPETVHAHPPSREAA